MPLLNIIYEDDIILVCNKPSGLMVEPDRNNFPNLLQQVKNYLKETTGEKLPYIQHLHRLDRPTSGIILFTKKREYLKTLSEQFAQRQVQKFYEAITSSAPSALIGTLEHWHRKEKKKAIIVNEAIPFSEKVKLEYTIKPYKNYFLWNIKLHTGKYHQIRAQLANIGCSILGDELYDSKDSYVKDAIALHATKLTILHPLTKMEISFETVQDFFLS